MKLPVNVAMRNCSAPGLDHQPMLEWRGSVEHFIGKEPPHIDRYSVG